MAIDQEVPFCVSNKKIKFSILKQNLKRQLQLVQNFICSNFHCSSYLKKEIIRIRYFLHNFAIQKSKNKLISYSIQYLHYVVMYVFL